MIPATIGLWLATYKIQLITGLVAVVVMFILLKSMLRLLRFGVFLAAGAAAGIGVAWGLLRLGVNPQYAHWAAVGAALAVLLLGMRRRRSGK